jgi:N-glycosylase/DNA lyase
MKKALFERYEKKKEKIKRKLKEFRNLPKENYFDEFIFCMLTPQSNAKKCWDAVEQLKTLKNFDKYSVSKILKTRTRFHNNKAGYVLKAKNSWPKIKEKLNNQDRQELRDFLTEKVLGYGLKEASHFLRNIGKSENKLAILDRHILKNLKEFGVTLENKIKSKKHYLEIEKKFLSFSEKIGIPIDELDLLFWSKENGEIFK